MNQKGQALVETSLIVGLLFILILAVVGIEKVGNTCMALQMAARYGARVATLKRSSPEKEASRLLQEMLPSLDSRKARISIDRNGSVTTMSIEMPLAVSGLPGVIPVVKASAAMARPVLGWY